MEQEPVSKSESSEESKPILKTTRVVEKIDSSTTAAGEKPVVDSRIKIQSAGKVLLFILSLYLFILAITLMKDGARGLEPLIDNILSISNPANGLGFGWLASYLIMSGSPVAAAAVTFFDAGIIDSITTFAMITGSRIGASFIVLLIGFLYVLRGRDRATSLSMGLLALLVTITTYLPSFFLGAILLNINLGNNINQPPANFINALVDRLILPVSSIISGLLPDWAVFLVGLGIILLSFNLFDKCLPQMTLKESQFGRVSRLVYHPMVMFTIGAAITMISMSVSLSLSILVPLSNRGYIRRENVIPYILGANITTFIDTLFAASLLDNPSVFGIVLISMISITIVSITLLLTIFRPYQYRVNRLVYQITSNNRNMAIFLLLIFMIPLVMIFI